MEYDIGDFLRSRRARIQPEEVGLLAYGRRRVPGLRREELAQLAGVSVDYYVRLEQGRSRQVSNDVLTSIGRALRLGDAELDHLRTLAHPPRSMADVVTGRQVIRPGLRRLLDMMDMIPAFVLGRRTDVLAWNRLGDAVAGFSTLPSRRNLAHYIFTDPRAHTFYQNWDSVAADTVAYLSFDAARHPGDPQLAALLEELSLSSVDFRRLWARHDVLDRTHGAKAIRHPVAGELDFAYQTFTVPDEPDQVIVTFTVAAGSPSDERLRMLGSWGVPVASAEQAAADTIQLQDAGRHSAERTTG